METNDILVSTSAAVSSSHHHAGAMIHWGLLAQIEWLASIVVCATIVWLAICNLLVLCHRQLTTIDIKTIDCRIRISHYMLMFLTVVWLLAFSSAANFCIATVLLCEGSPMGEAQKLVVNLNAQAPVTIAFLLVTVTAVHVIIGIVVALRKRNLKQET